jgi:hypothetical protein
MHVCTVCMVCMVCAHVPSTLHVPTHLVDTCNVDEGRPVSHLTITTPMLLYYTNYTSTPLHHHPCTGPVDMYVLLITRVGGYTLHINRVLLPPISTYTTYIYYQKVIFFYYTTTNKPLHTTNKPLHHYTTTNKLLRPPHLSK